MSRKPSRSNQSVRNEQVYVPVLLFRLFPSFCWFLHLFLISCVVELLRLSDMLVLIFVLLVLLFIFDIVCCKTTETVGWLIFFSITIRLTIPTPIFRDNLHPGTKMSSIFLHYPFTSRFILQTLGFYCCSISSRSFPTRQRITPLHSKPNSYIPVLLGNCQTSGLLRPNTPKGYQMKKINLGWRHSKSPRVTRVLQSKPTALCCTTL
jgi:hypothetical protein